MRLLCLGDVAISDPDSCNREWPAPDGITPGEADQVLFNFELPLGEEANPRPRDSGPRLLGCPQSLQVLRKWAPGIATLANNHIVDAGAAGLIKTKDLLCSNGFKTIGAGTTEEEIQQPIIWKTQEGSLAIFNWVFPETHPDWMSFPGPNCWPGLENAGQILEDYKRKVTWIIAVVHWSDELFPYPRPEDRMIAAALTEKGVDLIIGQHPHVVRGMEIIRECPVFYSLGNFFFSNMQDDHGNWITREAPRNRESLGVWLDFSKENGVRFSTQSFWQSQGMVVTDQLCRAERRLQNCSKPLNTKKGAEYLAWYRKKRYWFNHISYRFHFRLWQLGFGGIISTITRKLRRELLA